MRRVFALILSWILISCGFSGCRDLGRTSVPNEQNFVSAVGLDREDGVWNLSITVAGGIEETTRFLSSTDETLGKAFERIVAGSVGELRFSHCRAIVLGESVSEKNLSDALRFCADRLKIPLSARMISTDNAKRLLTAAEGGNGYEISDVADKTAKKLGFGGHTALYEIETARIQSLSLFAMPRFSGDGLQITGLTVYKEDKPVAHLDMGESRVYAVLRNVFEGGEITNGEESERIESASSKMDFMLSDDRLYIDISLHSDPKSKLLFEEVEAVLSVYDTDIFGIELRLERKNPEIYEKIKSDFEGYYKNAKFTVREGS